MKLSNQGVAASNVPWSARAAEEVPELRRAITARINGPAIAAPVAPMMGELLTRLESFSEPPRTGALTSPPPPGGQPMSESAASAALHTAYGGLRERILSGGDDSRVSSSLQTMVHVIENHLKMKGEILARCASETTPG